MESYRTEEEQVEALKRWWDENGRSTVVAIVIALAAGFGWQGWQAQQRAQAEAASDMYQALLTAITADISTEQQQKAADLAEQIKREFDDSTYAQFAALHLARMAVEKEDLPAAEAQLRWVLERADPGSDSAQLARLRLGRVVAATGDTDQALAILAQGGSAYQAAYAIARGDALLAAGRRGEALDAYATAQALSAASGRELSTLQAKLQSLSSLPEATDTGVQQAPDTAVSAPPAADGEPVRDAVAEGE